MIYLILAGVAIAIGVVVYIFVYKGSSGASKIVVQPDTASMLADAWVFSFSPTMPTHPTARPSGGWYFNFPAQDGVHYIMVPYTASKPHTMLSITFKVTPLLGAPEFVSVDHQADNTWPADFRPMLERAGDIMAPNQPAYRYWAHPINPDDYKLVADGKTITRDFPLTPDRWTDVNGQFAAASPAQFTAALQNLQAVALTFGGGGTAGHGVYVKNGTARFDLLDFKIV